VGAAAVPAVVVGAPAGAQPDAPVTVSVRHVNDFAAGYDAGAHTYREGWLRDVLTDARRRAVVASAGGVGRRVRIPQTPSDDAQRTCPDFEATVPPEGAAALRWIVRGPDPTTGRVRVLDTATRAFKPLVHRRQQGVDCFPSRRPLAVTNAEVHFEASLPTRAAGAQTPDAPSYTIDVEVLDGDGRAIAAGTSPAFVIPRRVPLVVSIGDSYASGQGNPDRPGQARGGTSGTVRCRDRTSWAIRQGHTPAMARAPRWFDARDHRSLLSAPARAVRELFPQWPYVVFLSFARSGANVRSDDGERDIADQAAQVRRVVGTHRIDALIVSGGGNDVGFATTLTRLTTGDPVDVARTRRAMDSLRTHRYAMLRDTIAALGLNVGATLVTEYPRALFNKPPNRPAEGCGIFQVAGGPLRTWKAITPREAAWIDSVGGVLNEAVAEAARRNGWRLVDGIDEAARGHGYCSGQSWYVFAEDSCLRQGNFDGTMHPNAEGTGSIAAAIARELRAVLPAPPGPQVVRP
jgi:lysophospholipase L1-like esterase